MIDLDSNRRRIQFYISIHAGNRFRLRAGKGPDAITDPEDSSRLLPRRFGSPEILRMNGDWETYWRNLGRNAAANDNASRAAGSRVA